MDKIKLEQKASNASCIIHDLMLADGCNYPDYDGDQFALDRLYEGVLVICRDDLPNDADLKQVVSTFFTSAGRYDLSNDELIDWDL
jgi:hypothetical protein